MTPAADPWAAFVASPAPPQQAPQPAPVAIQPLPNLPGYVSDPGYTPPAGQEHNPAWQPPSVPLGGPAQGDPWAAFAPQASAPPEKSYLTDAADGFTQPLQAWFHTMGEHQRANLTLPKNALDVVRGLVPDPTILGAPGAAAAAITGLVTRPLGHFAGNHLPTPYAAPQPTLEGGHLGLTAPQPMNPTDAAQGVIELALAGARPKLPEGIPFGPKATVAAPSLEDLKAAKTAAYQNVDQMGVAYSPQAASDLAKSINLDLAGSNISPTRHPKAFSVAQDITGRLNSGQPMPLTSLDQIRQEVWRDAASPKHEDAEQFFGGKINRNIDQFVNNATPGQMVGGNPQAAADAIATARDLNSRYRKVQTVTDALDSAGLRAGSTYSGGNYPNAVRQQLRPYVDPTSPKQIPNMTLDEATALRGVVEGTPLQNVLRYASKAASNKFLQTGAMVATPHGVGYPVLEAVAGGLRKASEKQTESAVQKLIDLMAMGGSHPTAPGYASLPPVNAVPVLSGPGAVGVNAVLQPLRPTRAQLESVRQSPNAR